MDKKAFSVRRAAALVLALVMVLSTMTVMVFAADKVSVTIKGLHDAQLSDVKLYTYVRRQGHGGSAGRRRARTRWLQEDV